MNSILNDLKNSDMIEDYKVENLDAEGNLGHSERGRNSERLTITFSNGEKLVISTWCSGCAENTGFSFERSSTLCDGAN